MKLETNVTRQIFQFRRNNSQILSHDVNILSKIQGMSQREVANPKQSLEKSETHIFKQLGLLNLEAISKYVKHWYYGR